MSRSAIAPVITQANINDATALLPKPTLVGRVALEGIDVAFALADYIPDLPNPFFDRIIAMVEPAYRVIEALTGDAGAILTHADQLHDLAESVRTQASAVDAAGGRLGSWEGIAAEACRATFGAAGECVLATADAIDAVAAAHLALGAMVANARLELIDLTRDLMYSLGREVYKALSMVGLALRAGAITVVASTVSGAAGGLVDGLGDFLSSRNPMDVVNGAVDGAQDGLQEGLRQALDIFIAAAGAILAPALRRIDEFINDAIEPMVSLIGDMTGYANLMDRAASLLTRGSDPGNQSDAPDSGEGLDAQGTSPQLARDADLISLNAALVDGPLPEGYTRATDKQLAALGLTPDMLTDDNGFIAEVFIDADGNPVVAFGGTTVGPGGAKPDVIEDAIGGGTMSPQTEQTLAIADAIANSPRGDDVVYTGHSLGGRLASIASLASGNAAVTYNAAGVSDATVQYIANANGTTPEALLSNAEAGQVRAYQTGGDQLTFAQESIPFSSEYIHDGVGAPIEIGEGGHVTQDVEESFEDEYGVNVPDPEDSR